MPCRNPGSPTQSRVRSGSGRDGDRLRREVAALTRARHPSVEELLDVNDDGNLVKVVTSRVAGRPPSHAVQSVAELAGLLAGVATTVADMHEIGVAHGSIGDKTVIVRDDGQHVLVDLSAATLLDGPSRRWALSAAATADVAALRGLVETLLGRVTPDLSTSASRLQILIRRATTARKATARAMAEAFAAVPGATLPRADDDRVSAPGLDTTPAKTRPREAARRRVRFSLGVGVGLLGLAAPAAASSGLFRTSAARDARSTDQTRPAQIPAYARGVLTVGADHFAIGEPGDVILLGRWICQPTPTVAMLRSRDQTVWLFPEWASPQRALRGVALGRVVDAVGARLHQIGSCDAIAVRRVGGSEVLIQPWQQRP